MIFMAVISFLVVFAVWVIGVEDNLTGILIPDYDFGKSLSDGEWAIPARVFHW
jgi:hypothetical protein